MQKSGIKFCLLSACFLLTTGFLLNLWCTCYAQTLDEGVCARVRIQLSQEAVIARNAFKATLGITNAPENVPLENLKVTLNIIDRNNQSANGLFGIYPPELSGINDINGNGLIQPGITASGTWLIVPTRDAAPDEPLMYYVGGELSYVQGSSLITMPLFPAPILVMPDPLLVLDYFWVRDVYSDDPFTTEIEPAEPFPLGLMVRNNGKGVANNFNIAGSQPQIVENEKGLLIEFKLISAQVNSEIISPSLTLNLGNIDPGTISVAKWMMTCSLQGKFIEYKATFEHVDGLGNPRLSLIDSVNIHELTHAVRVDVPSDDNKPDFLVNDVPDDDHLPDTLFDSTGPTEVVNIGQNPSVNWQIVDGHLEAHVTATVPTGWVYIRATDPGQEQFRLTRVVRSDGREIRLDDNAWTTHRTIRLVGQPPYREHLLHLFDKDSTGSYTLIYEVSGTDSDGDGIPDSIDNCPDVPNPDQKDTDGDGLGDACDPDDDNDGLPDLWEISHGLNPLDPTDASRDSDSDGLTNSQEFTLGTDPLNRDTDGDGFSDGDEVNAGTDPLNKDSMPNHPPVSNAGSDQNVITNKLVTLNGSESDDPEGTLIIFLWKFIEVPAGSTVTDASLSDTDSAKPTFTPDVDGTYRLRLVVNDGVKDSEPDEVSITAAVPNVAPNANAGPDQNVLTAATVYLDGSVSNDPDNGPQLPTYLWSFDSVPVGSMLSYNDIVDRDKAHASFIPDVDGTYSLRLTIGDGELNSEDTMQIIAATSDVPPNANAGSDIIIYIGETAILNGSASNDPDNSPQPLNYSWSFVAVPNGSNLNNDDISEADTISPSFVPDVVGTYVIKLTVDDSLSFDSDNVAITVIPAASHITVSPRSINFGSINVGDTSSPQSVTISNGGVLDLEITSLSITGVDSPEFSILSESDTCSGQTVQPSGACTVQLTFSPLSPGVKSATLEISSNDPYENPALVSLSGTGICMNVYYRDADEDDYGNPNESMQACEQPVGYVTDNTDCDDKDASVNPAAPEICDDKDNDCNSGTGDDTGETWYGSSCDGPDLDLCEEGLYTCLSGIQTCSDNTTNNVEVCDGVNNDCDPSTPDGSGESWYGNLTSCGMGVCSSTGELTCSGGNQVDTCTPDSPTGDDSDCDGLDDNCDGIYDNNYKPTNTTCGLGICASTGQLICSDGKQVDTCTPGNPSGDDSNCDGIDDDCNGAPDNNYVPTPTTCGIGTCSSTGQLICNNSTLFDTCTPGLPQIEICNGFDDNCDGNIDEGVTTIFYQDADEDGYGTSSSSTQSCTQPAGYVANNTDCNDSNPAINTGMSEVPYNAIDDDCNPATKDDDLDGDGYVKANDCDDNNGAINPGATEIFGNGLDDDCNPATPDSPLDVDDDKDGYTENQGDCNDADSSVKPGADEVCGDGIDQDCNGFDLPCDRDGDSVEDNLDNCLDVPNTDQADLDGDGIGDACDGDVDGDGIANNNDNCPALFNSDQTDFDNDGIGDACDLDDDNDGVLDQNDQCPNTPSDEVAMVDAVGCGPSQRDQDEDGIVDELDNCPLAFNPDQVDNDLDGVGDVCDSDDDNDSVPDNLDNCLLIPNLDQADADGDGIGNACDDDIDGDGVLNSVDNCLYVANPDQVDMDSDGIGDVCDDDIDGDTISNSDDNCPYMVNPAQTDMDNDGLGDACDTDNDNDGVADLFDNCPYVTNSDQKDSDGDKLGDVCDNCPNVGNPDQTDSDGDGIGDACESGEVKTICSILGNDPKPWILDIDIFKFRGTKGEIVAIRLEANPPGMGAGKRATLILTDKIKGTVLVKLDRSELPNEITAKLPKTGEYLITVAQPLLIAKDKRYKGGYCLTLKASPGTYQTLAPYLWVE
jgi:hypothetical protein